MTPRLHMILWKRQHGLCWICAEPMLEWPRLHPLAWSYDHVQPLGANGANRPGNKLLAHRDCNNERGMASLPQGVKLRPYVDAAISRLALVYKRRFE